MQLSKNKNKKIAPTFPEISAMIKATTGDQNLKTTLT
jgi:hypothetical protein